MMTSRGIVTDVRLSWKWTFCLLEFKQRVNALILGKGTRLVLNLKLKSLGNKLKCMRVVIKQRAVVFKRAFSAGLMFRHTTLRFCLDRCFPLEILLRFSYSALSSCSFYLSCSQFCSDTSISLDILLISTLIILEFPARFCGPQFGRISLNST